MRGYVHGVPEPTNELAILLHRYNCSPATASTILGYDRYNGGRKIRGWCAYDGKTRHPKIPDSELNKLRGLLEAGIPDNLVVRQRRKLLPTDDRFWDYVDKSGGPDACWPWTAYVTEYGYGMCTSDRGREWAHRFAFYLANAKQPLGDLLVCHKCDNPPCCNPKHLFKGTQADNMHDMMSKEREAYNEKHNFSKLREEVVINILKDSAAGYSRKTLADKYGVHVVTISRIRHGRIWKRAFKKYDANRLQAPNSQ